MLVGKFPLVHLRHLRQEAEAANCPGLLRQINYVSVRFLERRRQQPQIDEIPAALDAFDDDSVLEAAWDKMNQAIDMLYPGDEDAVDDDASKHGEKNCHLCVFLTMLRIAQVLPTLDARTRRQIDNYLLTIP